MWKLHEIFKVLKNSKKNNFRRNYSRKYGIPNLTPIRWGNFNYFIQKLISLKDQHTQKQLFYSVLGVVHRLRLQEEGGR
jgi:hypothetical protein